jgi:DNA polymerase alpha subunit A
MERSRRNVQSRTAKLAGVLDELKAARDGTAKRSLELKEEEAVFDVVDEEQYEQILAKRRLEAGA